MPTGYTMKLLDGEVSFKDFVMQCAHAFTVHDEPIPKRWKVGSYHREEIAKAKKELRRVKGLSEKACEEEAKKCVRRATDEEREWQRKTLAAKERLVAMESKVAQWVPPTDDHKELKKFMLEQLALTIDKDTNIAEQPVETCSGKEWQAKKLEALEDDLAYHTRELEEEKAKVAKLNRWIQALRKSLKNA